MISLNNVISYISSALNCSLHSKKTCSFFNVQTASSDTIHLLNDFMALTTIKMPIVFIDMLSVSDSESKRCSVLMHKTFFSDSDSLSKMRNTENASMFRCHYQNVDDCS